MLRASIKGLALSALLISTSAWSWGMNGHRVVGELAQQHLTPATEKAVKALLSEDSLAEVSTWADEMRANPDTFWKKQSGKWHYINIKDPSKMAQHNKAIEHKHQVKHILDGINYAVTTLKNTKASKEDKQFALKFLVHLVGDAHQPFHAGRSEDRGGNLIKVTFFKEETNLHSVFDTKLIEHQSLSYRELSDFIITRDKQKIAHMLDSRPADWLLESNQIAEKIYDSNETDISWGYIYRYTPVVKSRLLHGGIRLAGLLNQIFDKNSRPLETALKAVK
ncbi:S1/P1 nuclease [Pseudoalteromonas ardens]|uniref:S1/P1 Nuclease n=1 Tax=Pseudoalteromonas rubra TaxID=43658 RepID=A0A0L0ERP5_9GAMM|nr:S1/P1 nuclease [Pseudoalteromonas sp. R96]KNC67079.1 S1/P1 Nuclease [Pseudoalteromonas rubra]MDK1309908.1 S1/P1 nuclease [Pseudoalteromonas sp. R96]